MGQFFQKIDFVKFSLWSPGFGIQYIRVLGVMNMNLAMKNQNECFLGIHVSIFWKFKFDYII